MQTSLPQSYLETTQGQEVDKILRSCVHCGFCTATCPTFLLTGNELDSPRGRIYLIKEVLEGGPCSKATQTHLDRCLSCQSCETTCPSNVQYHNLLNIGRQQVEEKIGRSLWMTCKRFFIRKIFSNAALFKTILSIGQFFKPILPAQTKRSLPEKNQLNTQNKDAFSIKCSRKMIVLNGCVQQGLSPATNAACSRVLAHLNIQTMTVERENCCGALSYHLNAQEEGLNQARRNIDLLYQHLEEGVEAIISTASGCGNFVKDYADLLKDDLSYQEKAFRVASHCKDISEVLLAEDLSHLEMITSPKIAFHCPCTLQHGQQLNGVAEAVLARLGFVLTEVSNGHLCCGSAGTYSILQPELSQRLQQDKIKALEHNQPDAIATANIGCQNHLAAVSDKTVKHWIEYVDEGLKQ